MDSLTRGVGQHEISEREPLLGGTSNPAQLKSWRRPRPLWLVPFTITAALCRGMTLAPRTEVITQLACEELRSLNHNHHHQSVPHDHVVSPSPNIPFFHLHHTALPTLHPIAHKPSSESSTGREGGNMSDPTIDCFTDPAVQAGAAKLQTVMLTTMGILGALTTGWWGQFGDRHGRTKVLACSVAGLLVTDVMFIFASNPPDFLKGNTQQVLIIAPIAEGLLGGWSTLQGATQAYVSDCTSHGSRAHVYSRFAGVFFIGIAFGPEIAAFILRVTHNTTIVFYISAGCAFINLLLLLFVFPESLSNETRARNIAAAREALIKAHVTVQGSVSFWSYIKTAIVGFFKPLAILGPRTESHRRGRDWSMTAIAITLFCHYLSLGLIQINYLYAEHVFSWNAEKLSYYITAMSSTRALHLLIILPTVIRVCKPFRSTSNANIRSSGSKPVPTAAELSSEVKFDLLVAKISLGVGLLSQVLVTLAKDTSRVMFVASTAMAGFGSGVVPSLQSAAMSLLHVRENGEPTSGKGGGEVGQLFGAFAMLHAVGSMILGPILFGTVYSLTVAKFAKTIFVVAGGLFIVSAISLLLLRRPRVEGANPIHIRVDTQVEVTVERERGRSRKSKDIRR